MPNRRSMPNRPTDKEVRSLKENTAGKVVNDGNRNQWQWENADESTSHLLRRLENTDLSIESTDIVPAAPKPPARADRVADQPRKESLPDRSRPADRNAYGGMAGRDKAGGFNPYNNSGKSKGR